MATARRLLGSLALILLCASGCSDTRDPADEASRKEAGAAASATPDSIEVSQPPRLILLISIDTLRADHLGVYGYERFTSPNLDVFALEGAVFEDANSAAPWTLPSHATMLTGLYPMTHEAMTIASKLDETIATLPAMLAEQGWKTASVVATPWLVRDRHGITKDFEQYKHVRTRPERRRPSTLITDEAIGWVEAASEAGEQLFVFVHYFDVHADYKSEPGYEDLFVSPYDGDADGSAWQILTSTLVPEYIEFCKNELEGDECSFGPESDNPKFIDEHFVQPTFDDRDARHLVDLYDAGVRQMDAELSRLFASLGKKGHLEDALVIVTSDHGEAFGEHGEFDHFLSAYQEVLHVPLIMRGPGVPAGARIDVPVSLVDIVPTVLELAGAPPMDGADGRSLVPLLRGEDDVPFRQRSIFSDAPGGLSHEMITPGFFPVRRAVRRDQWKLVHDAKSGDFALYDLATDPLEQIDLYLDRPEIASRLAEEMDRRYGDFDIEALRTDDVELSEEEKAQLRALGYMP